MSSDAKTGSSTNRWFVLALLTLTLVLSYADRVLLGALAPFIQAELHLSDTQLGLLTGTAFALFFAVAGMPLGRMADSVSRNWILAASVAIWSLMTAGSGLAGGFIALLAFRIGVGAGEAGAVPPSHSLISELFPPRKRATALAIFHSGWAFGIAGGLAIGAWLGERYGWRAAFAIVGLPGLTLALALFFMVPEPRRYRSKMQMQATNLWADTKDIFARRALIHIIVTAGVGNIAFAAMTTWMSLFFIRSHDMTPAEAGGFVGGLTGLGMLPGLLAGGWLADLLARRDARLPMYLLSAAALACALFFLGTLWAPDRPLALASVCAAVFAGTITSAPLMAYVQNLAPTRLRSTCSALVMLTNAILGAGLGPLASGLLSDSLAPTFGEDSLRWSLTICLAPHLIYALLLLGTVRLLPKRFESAAVPT